MIIHDPLIKQMLYGVMESWAKLSRASVSASTLFSPWKKQLQYNTVSLWEQQFSQSPTERQAAWDIVKHARPILQAHRGDRVCENREKLRVYVTYGVGWLFFLLYSWSSFMRSPTVCVRKMHIFSHSSPAVKPQLHLNLWPVQRSAAFNLVCSYNNTNPGKAVWSEYDWSSDLHVHRPPVLAATLSPVDLGSVPAGAATARHAIHTPPLPASPRGSLF